MIKSNTTFERSKLDDLDARTRIDKRAALVVFAMAGVPMELIEHANATGTEPNVKTTCPVCGVDGSFSLILGKKTGRWFARCSNCKGGRIWSPVDFYATTHRGENVAAAVDDIFAALDAIDQNETVEESPESVDDTQDEDVQIIDSTQGDYIRKLFDNRTTDEEKDKLEHDPIELRRQREAAQKRRAEDVATVRTLPPYPVDAIPKSLLDYTQFYAEVFNAPVSTAIKQALANFSGLVARLFPMVAPTLSYTSTRPLRANLCALTIGDSGIAKSPLYEAILEPISLLQAQIDDDHRRLENAYEDAIEEQEKAALESKKLLSKLKRTDDAKTRAEISKQLDDLDAIVYSKIEPPRPKQELFFSPDTPEGTLDAVDANLLNGYQNAPIVTTDEAITAFQSTYNPRGTVAGFAKFSQIIDCKRLKSKLATKAGVGDNSNHEARIAAFNLGIQPEVFSDCFRNVVLRRQGFVNRFLVDDQTIDFTKIIDDKPIDESTRRSFLAVFNAAFETCKHYERDKRGNLVNQTQTGTGAAIVDRPPIMKATVYTLDDRNGTQEKTALDVFKSFRNYCRAKQAYFYRIGNKSLFSFYSKIQKISLQYAVLFRTWESFERIQGTFEPIDDSGLYSPVATIDAALMRRAVAVATWDGLKREAVGALVDGLGESKEGGAALPVAAQRILDVLAESPEKYVMKTDVVAHIGELRGKDNARSFERLIERLVEDGMIKRLKVKRGNNIRDAYQYVELTPEMLDEDTIDD